MHTTGQLKQLKIFNNKHSVYYHALFLALYISTQFLSVCFSLDLCQGSHIHQIPSVVLSFYRHNNYGSPFIEYTFEAVALSDARATPNTPLLGAEGAADRLWKLCG